MTSAGRWLVSLALLAGSASSWGAESVAVHRVALVVGANDGGEGRVGLRYANSDAKALASVLQDVGGVGPEDVVLVEDATVARMEAGFASLSRRIAGARAYADRVEVIVYYSGHADERGLLPGGVTYSYDQLRQNLGRVDADVRVTILDACESGAVLRAKGGQRRPSFLIDTSNTLRGEAFLTSSTASEASQESDRIQASYFTHHLVAGLRGAADQDEDGRVTLSEAYVYTFRETRESTEGSRIGAQSPGWSLDLAGQGDVVLSEVRMGGAHLEVGALLDGELWLRGSDGRLFAQVTKVSGKPLSLSMPPDTYQVRLRSGSTTYGTVLSIASGHSTQLVAEDLREQVGHFEGRTRGTTTGSHAPEAGVREPTVPAHAAFVGPGPRSTRESPAVRGFAFHVLGGRVRRLDGLGIGLLSTHAQEGLRGAQFASGWALAGGDVAGLQGAGLLNVAGGSLNGFQGSILMNIVGGNSPKGTFGTQFTGVGNIAHGGLRGAQLAVLFNVGGHAIQGAQLAAGVNVSRGHVQGMQASIVGNYTLGVMRGVQWGGVFNAVEGLGGVQLATVNYARSGNGLQLGAVNVGRKVRGAQIGLVNVADHLDGEALGLISIIRNGYHSVTLGTSDVQPLEVNLKFGSRHVYSTLVLGFDPTGDMGLAVGGGLGAHADLFDGALFVDVDAVVRMREALPDRGTDLGVGLLTSIRATFGRDVKGPLGLWIGPALHMMVPFGEAPMPSQTFMPTFAMGGVEGAIGYQAGLSLRF